MTREALCRKCSSMEQVLYMAIELSKAQWKVAFTECMARQPRIRLVEPHSSVQLAKEIEEAKARFSLPADVRVVVCHEAGPDGFSVHRVLEGVGVESIMVDAASIEVPRRKRRKKTDRLDARKLVRMLIRHVTGEKGVWGVVRVPSEQQEDERRLHRERGRLIKERTGHRARIQALLATVGVKMKPYAGFVAHLGKVRTCSGKPLGDGLKGELIREYERLQLVEEQLKAVKAEQEARVKAPQTKMDRQVAQLMRLRGVGIVGSWVVVKEFFGWRQFRNRKQVGALAGLVGTPYQSGKMEREQGISKAGNRLVRTMMIQLAWSWIRWQPTSQLTLWFDRRFAHGGKRARRRGIVAVARRLLVAVWRYLESGVVPEGAILDT